MGEEENLWEIMIQEQFEGNSRHPGNMVLYENYLILAAGLRGVRIYDLSNPEEPEEVNVLIYSCDRIVLVGDRLLVYRVNTLRLLDISDPEAPELIGQLTIGNEEYPYYYLPVLAGGCVFLPNDGSLQREASILVLDLTAENSPIEVGRIDLGVESAGFFFQISNNRLYVKYGANVNVPIWDLTNDFDIEYDRTVTVAPGDYKQFLVNENLLFLSTEFHWHRPGHTLIYNTDPVSVPDSDFILPPSSLLLFPAYPNPFNSTTTITYGLPFASNVSLYLNDLAGREVRTLVDGNKQPGMHNTSLTADNLPTGLYFIRLNVSDQIFTRKVMLIR